MSQSTFTIGIKYDTEALNQLASQLAHIAELMDRIHGRRYDAGMTLSVDKGTKAGVAADSFKVCDSEQKLRVVIPSMKETIHGPVQTTEIINDDHIRQIVREELRQFVSRELMSGGLLSR